MATPTVVPPALDLRPGPSGTPRLPAAAHGNAVDVHLILQLDDGRVLLAERAGTGYADGRLVVPGGKLEPGEDVRAGAIREAHEELGVQVDPDAVRFAGVVHHLQPDGTQARVGFFFTTRHWHGQPVNAEPHKCARLLWVDPHHLPAATLPYSARGIAQLVHAAEPFLLDGWPTDTA